MIVNDILYSDPNLSCVGGASTDALKTFTDDTYPASVGPRPTRRKSGRKLGLPVEIVK
jgi:hypothetical protein